LGRGATAEVLLAHDRELDRHVAIKLLSADLPRFAREAVVAARLSRHQGVVSVHDVGRWHGRPFLVMEFLPGGSLKELLRDRRVTPAQALEWLREVAEAVDAAHALGFVHRDLKPANLLLDDDGRVQVSDFGLARPIEHELTPLTTWGAVVGTAGYLSPEQARGEPATPASDRYALAVIAYELLAGRRPFENESPFAEIAAQCSEPVPPLAARPAALDLVFRRALSTRPGDRYASAAEFVDALELAFAEHSSATAVLSPGGELDAAVTTTLRRYRASRRILRVGRWAKRAGALLAAAALGAAGVAAYAQTQTKKPAAAVCTVSPSNHDANLVAGGANADAYCVQAAQRLGWETRSGLVLRSPDLGGRLGVVCRIRSEQLQLTVYDDGRQRIGHQLCTDLLDQASNGSY
jgi:hypothetical protein